MNAADLARLEIAKRAYAAAQPSATEVQTGVRRARLSLRRVKSRRNWFAKGLVLVVLAVGSLAYAKPRALGELVESLAHTGDTGTTKRGGSRLSVPAAVRPSTATSTAKANASEIATPPSVDVSSQATQPTVQAAHEPTPRAVSAKTTVHRSRVVSEVAASAVKVGALAAEVALPASKTPATPAAVSDWGRVAQALASGDENTALAALSELSDSSDERTRAKADLGRAQLFIAHGDSAKGCALVRSLSTQRGGGPIERQAQLLLKSCTR